MNIPERKSTRADYHIKEYKPVYYLLAGPDMFNIKESEEIEKLFK